MVLVVASEISNYSDSGLAPCQQPSISGTMVKSYVRSTVMSSRTLNIMATNSDPGTMTYLLDSSVAILILDGELSTY